MNKARQRDAWFTGTGARGQMPDDSPERPTTNHPLHGERRPRVTPVIAVVGLFAAIALVFIVLTWLRYNT